MSESTQKRAPQLSVPLDSATLAKIKSAAQADRRSVAGYARLVLEKELERQGHEGTA
jgi:hypothetical protein